MDVVVGNNELDLKVIAGEDEQLPVLFLEALVDCGCDLKIAE